ncbi:hypothetical protein ACHAXT_009056 [Thalassiosira profunda]
MNAATTHTHNKTPPPTRRADRRVAIAEMRRLMAVYGPTKCLRKGPSTNALPLKADSVKRKFYRWFPDLDARFVRDATGRYAPKAGHEAEIRYREEMRAKDGEALAKKRSRCRKRRQEGEEAGAKKVKVEVDEVASAAPMPSIEPTLVSRVVSSDESSCSSASYDEDLFGSAKSSAVVEDTDPPLDLSFLDDVIAPPSCYGVASSWESDASSIDELLDRSLEECCEEILGSDDDASVSGYLFGINI